MTTAANLPTDVILGLVPRTNCAAGTIVTVRAVTVQHISAICPRGWMGPRDKPEDDIFGRGAIALAYEETRA